MKNLTMLLTAAVLVTSTTGCCVCRRITSLCNRGAYCGTTSTPSFVAPSSAPIVLPQQTPPPIVIPQPAPQQIIVPQPTSFAPACPCDMGCNACQGYTTGGFDDCGCGGFSGTVGSVPTIMSGPISTDPGPIPTPPGPLSGSGSR